MSDPTGDPRALSAIELIHRTGAKHFSLRYQDDEEPVAWVALAGYVSALGNERWECAGALNPVRAILRLCEALIDGGTCVHCKRPAGFEPDDIEEQPLDQLVCWYQWDPELSTYRRGCEGA